METKDERTTSVRSRAGTFGAELDWRQLLHSLWLRILHAHKRLPKSLRLCESLSLGERRFLAVVECEGARFLVGGTASSLAMLVRLDDRNGQRPFLSKHGLSQEEDAG